MGMEMVRREFDVRCFRFLSARWSEEARDMQLVEHVEDDEDCFEPIDERKDFQYQLLVWFQFGAFLNG